MLSCPFYVVTPDGPTRWDKLAHKLRQGASSYWTVAVVSAAVTVMHLVWLMRSDHAGEVVSGFGSVLVVLGVWVAAFPFIRHGLTRVVDQMPRVSDVVLPEFRSMALRREERDERAKQRRDQIDERIWGVAIVLLGTLLNGYGAPLARLAGLPT